MCAELLSLQDQAPELSVFMGELLPGVSCPVVVCKHLLALGI